MKTYSIITILAAAAFTIGGCSTAYQAQTPDAVYYSPQQNNARYSTSSNNGQSGSNGDQSSAVEDNNNPNSGKYVVYDNGQGDNSGSYSYDDYYNSQRINLFDNPDNLYAFNNSMMWNDPYSFGPSYFGSPYSFSLGLGFGPYSMWNYPSLGFGYVGGLWNPFYSPFGMGGLYNPYAFGGGYLPYYSPYLMNYGYYGGGYGYYGSNKLGGLTRSAGSFVPRRSANSPAYINGYNNSDGTIGTSSPRRIFTTNEKQNLNNNGNTYRVRTERVFTQNPNEHPENLNTNQRIGEKKSGFFRIFQRQSTVQPREVNERYMQPQQEQRTFYRPPERTFEAPRMEVSPSFNSNSGSQGAPTRTFSPRGR